MNSSKQKVIAKPEKPVAFEPLVLYHQRLFTTYHKFPEIPFGM